MEQIVRGGALKAYMRTSTLSYLTQGHIAFKGLYSSLIPAGTSRRVPHVYACLMCTCRLSVMAASLLSRDYESFFADLKGYTTSEMTSPPSVPPSCSIE